MKRIDFENGTVTNNILSAALPMLVAQILNLLYNIVDRIYIARIHDIGTTALGAVGLCFPIIMIITAFSNLFGSGGAPIFSINRGKGDSRTADMIMNTAFTMLCGSAAVLMLIGFLFARPLLTLFGASDDALVYAYPYLMIYLLGTLPSMIATGMNPFINAQGYAIIGMLSVTVGAVANIILDPIFIFALGMGVKGAAFATIISQCVSAVWIVSFLCSKKSEIRLTFAILRPKFAIIKKISSLGASPFVMQATESAIFVVFNSGLQRYGGDIYVGAMTIMQSVMQIIFIPTQGFANGVQPIISYNFGAKKFERVKEVIRKMLFVNGIITVCLVLSASVFPTRFASLFTSSGEILQIEQKLLPVYIAGLWLMWIQNSAQTTFVGIGNAKVSVFIACLRKIILLIPLALVLPKFFGVEGIFFAEPIATTCSALTSTVLLIRAYRKM